MVLNLKKKRPAGVKNEQWRSAELALARWEKTPTGGKKAAENRITRKKGSVFKNRVPKGNRCGEGGDSLSKLESPYHVH